MGPEAGLIIRRRYENELVARRTMTAGQDAYLHFALEDATLVNSTYRE